ncbi:MAG: ATP-binding protein, partial [Aquaticitalea sp.]
TNSKDDYYLKHIRSASGYMTQLVEELLEFSKLEGGNIIIEAIPFKLSSIVQETSENIQANHTDKPIDLIVNQDLNMDRTILSDPFRIKQILYNLIGNAYKFTEKGSITVTSKLVKGQDKNFAVITVEDTGIGIGKEKQQDIFKAFTQINNPNGDQQNGFGLGLAITKKLVDLLKGTLRLESEPGKGSTFFVSIPVKLSDKQIQTAPTPLEIPEFDLKAIVVDDDPSLRQLITDILKQHKIEVHGFEDAKAALSEMDKLSFDLIITDIQLPKMNGFHFMETVKKMPTYQQQPIIAMTGRMDLDAEHFLESGFSSVIFKPFTADTLLNSFMELFPDAIQTSRKINKKLIQNSNLFDITSISGFLDHDETALKSMLKRFLEDTKKTMSILKNAAKTNDVQTINDLSHRMLTMFKQLRVDSVVAQLESLENITEVKEEEMKLLESNMATFYNAMDAYITQDDIP